MGNQHKKIARLCYLCGKPGADTREHIPPRGIFPKNPSGQLITVPAHLKCNQQFDKDDELFRDKIIMASWRSIEGKRAYREIVRPSLHKNPGIKRKLREALTIAWIEDSVSKTLIPARAIKLECDLVERQIDRWTRGLFYHKFKHPLSPTINIQVDRLNPPEQSVVPFVLELAKQGIQPKWVDVEPGVFTYTYLTTFESNNIGLALFLFFDTEVYLGSTGTATSD